MKKLYEPYEPFNKGYLDVGDDHIMYFEESGNPKGIPIVYVHGGPGDYLKPRHRQIFNPVKYHVIQYDQRGCGKSKFKDMLKNNTTQALVDDLEKLRKYLKFDKWILNGRSWGSTIVLAYAIKYPEKVKAIITGGVFLAQLSNAYFVYKFGATQIFPETYKKFVDYFIIDPSDDLKKLCMKLKRRIYDKDLEVAYKSTMVMFDYEESLMLLEPEKPEKSEEFQEIKNESKVSIVNSGKIFLHYMENENFLKEDFFFKNISKIKGIPTVIIQGRYDLVCPYINAWKLHNIWPEAEFITTIAGHHSTNPGNLEEILEYTEQFSDID
jgi:proline iminopeptidase